MVLELQRCQGPAPVDPGNSKPEDGDGDGDGGEDQETIA